MNLIALKMLIGDRAKYLGLIFGILFSTLLMSQQLSLFIGLMGRTASLIQDTKEADIWVMDKRVAYIDGVEPLPDSDLGKVKSIDGVKWAVPFFKNQVVLRIGQTLQSATLVGVDDTSFVGAPRKMLIGKIEDLRQPDAIIMDKTGYRYIWPDGPFKIGQVIEANDRRMLIVGICDAMQPFSAPVIIYSRYSQAINYVGKTRNEMSFVLAKAKDGISPKEVASRIEANTNLKARSWDDFRFDTVSYYFWHTGIPINFGITVILGFIIGAVISGQTFYIFVIENLRQFAALKAIGVTNKQILTMVLTQGAVVGFVGFSIGIGLTSVFLAKASVSIPAFKGFYLPWQIALGTFAAVFLIIIISSLVSIRKVLVLDPAIVFRG